jgi:hypothetical protein
MRTVAVVVLDEDAEHSLKVGRLRMRGQSRYSERAVRTKRSAIPFALGDRIGVLMISTRAWSALRAQELAPGVRRAPRRPKAGLAQKVADETRGDREGQPAELAGDSLVAPARVLAREA